MSLASVCARRLLARRRRVLGRNLQILIDRPGTSKWTVLSVTRKSDQVLPLFMNWFLKLVREKVLLDGDHSRVAIRFVPQKPLAKAIMQIFLLFLALREPSPGTFLIAGTISLGLLAVFLHHKLG